ncbi:MAG: lytic transglycosylase domain-containing protein [Alphaproteobacteria bacterium]|nr:lytic transglycosylase domain-containing protein [Alphaproteobacteria bacterium]
MHRFFLALISYLVITTPAHATSDGQLLADYAQWEQMTDPSAVIFFDEGYRFLKRHSDWPKQNVIRMKTEEAALRQGGDIEAFCREFPPISGRGMIACARAGVGGIKEVVQGWIQGDFNADEEKMVLARYGAQLTEDNHRERISRLLFEGKTATAKRLIHEAGSYRPLYEARIALITNAGNANALVNKLPAHFKENAGLIFDRITWRHKRGMEEGVMELFAQAPSNPPHPDAWYTLRMQYARKALEKRQYARALDILSSHGQMKPEYLADTLWVKGWIRTEHLADARGGYEDFYQLYKLVKFPVSQSRAAYWAGRAARKNGNHDIAQEWFEKAAQHPTVFYGQMAALELDKTATLDLPSPISVDESERREFAQNDTPRLIALLIQQGKEEEADAFLLNLAQNTNDKYDLAILADFAKQHGQEFDAVRVSKLALQKQHILLNYGWPKIKIPTLSTIEPALALSITRQESEFNIRAVSPAGARGLMQLMPPTAQMMARKLGMGYTIHRLFEPEYNMILGTNYLGRLIDGFDGSYILAIASYNAGSGNVRKWIARFGMPPNNPEAAINWIESIPFIETRNYVMRALENVQVYRALLNPSTPIGLKTDLVR